MSQTTPQTMQAYVPANTIRTYEAAPERTPCKSETIGKLAEALAKAHLLITNVIENKENPYFKSSYADLGAIWDACRLPLSNNSLSISQLLNTDRNGRLMLTTLLLHSSGEYLLSEVQVISLKQDPQSIGSAITYMKRFALAAMVGVAPMEKKEDQQEGVSDRDDDGNAAMGKPQIMKKLNALPDDESPSTIAHQHHLSEAQLARLFALARNANLLNKAMLKPWIISNFGMPEGFSINDINQAQYQEICNALIDKAKGADKPEATPVKEVLPWQRPDFGVIK